MGSSVSAVNAGNQFPLLHKNSPHLFSSSRMAPSNSLLPCLAALVIFISPLALAEDDLNCDIQGWLEPGYVPPENPNCHPFDGSLVPDCGKYLVNNVTSYYHIHE